MNRPTDSHDSAEPPVSHPSHAGNERVPLALESEGPIEQVMAQGVDEEPTPGYQRTLLGTVGWVVSGFSLAYAVFHLICLNVYPLETWNYRMLHVMGALILGFALSSATTLTGREVGAGQRRLGWIVAAVAAAPVLYALVQVGIYWQSIGARPPMTPAWETYHFGIPLLVGTVVAILGGWFVRAPDDRIHPCDLVLILAAIASSGFMLVALEGYAMRMRAGTPFASPGNMYAAIASVALVCELTRRVAGLALVIIAGVFVLYSFGGPYLPGFLAHSGFSISRFFTYIYTDNGILGATTAVSSTYIILFIIFAAFLQASKVGDFFVNFAFSLAGQRRGGPAKVAVFASGLMGMINGTSAGNVVATGSLTIPLMKRVGYPAKTAGAVEAAASTGGQIMPPIMGAGAFIMAEVTGIPYTDIAIAAIIPSVLYFASVLFMVDLAAAKLGMKGIPRSQLPDLSKMLRQVHLFTPIIILIAALFMGYSVIRAGTLATVAAVVVSWLSPHAMGPRAILRALVLSGTMSIQIIAVCACAGIIVGVIALTGVGARFSSLLLQIAASSTIIDGQLLALFFAMLISIILGMGMPTTAAYAIAASVVAPGLIAMEIDPLTAHFFVFYYAVVSAITPPVALAGYAAAAISGSGPMETSVASFRMGLAAFIVPFMFFYSPALLMEGDWLVILRSVLTATIGVYLLAAGLQGWFFGHISTWMKPLLILAALLMIEGGITTDLIGAAIVGVVVLARFMTGRGTAHAG
ncbi:TRAP transporter permease [Indioceanicola profundi]|uniref:TRAP transporter permease n=1 Tax=Indioceanicola profundi TaxID=2220096 RepID=UPI001CED4368|nr:TRAP transporter permease [Indioceanicola profundi]